MLPGRWFSFKGRALRQEYWRLSLFVGALGLMLVMALVIASGALEMPAAELIKTAPADLMQRLDPILLAVVALFGFALAWMGLAVAVRRLHDRGKSGWWLLVYFAPAIVMWINGIAMAKGVMLLPAVGMAGLIVASNIAMGWYSIEMGFMRGKDIGNRFQDHPGNGIDGEIDDIGSWADRPIEELAAAAAAAEPRVLKSRIGQPARPGAGPANKPVFGRR